MGASRTRWAAVVVLGLGGARLRFGRGAAGSRTVVKMRTLSDLPEPRTRGIYPLICPRQTARQDIDGQACPCNHREGFL